MIKKIPKILIYFFLIVFILQLASLLFLLLIPMPSQAGDVQFIPQITIDETFQKGKPYPIPKSTEAIGEYVRAIYKYAIGIVGILAAVVLMLGGIIWLTAGGNTERISNAKSWIGASLTGLILALCSYMILATINPRLVEFKPIEVATVTTEKETSTINKTCEWTKIPSGKSCENIKEDWVYSNSSYCQGERPSLLHDCCCQEIDLSKKCDEECKGKGGWDYDAATDKCLCWGSGSHKECQKVPGLQPGEGSYQCVTVPFEGISTCDKDIDCRKKFNCCICNYYAYKNCVSGTDVSEGWCKQKCKSYIVPWRSYYTASAICDESKNCVSQ